MARVRFINEKKEIEVKEGRSIARAAHDAKIELAMPCRGAGSCGKCLVRVSDIQAVRNLPAARSPSREKRNEGMVLACHSLIIDDVDVYTLSPRDDEKNLKILESGIRRAIEPKPLISREYKNGKTVFYTSSGILGEEDADTTGNEMYAIVADIGTTTIVCSLISLSDVRECGCVSMLNPQCGCALDVIGRIQYCAENEGGLEHLFKEVSDAVDSMTGKLCEQYNVSRNNIYEAVYCGNTTMLHLAVNTDPYKLGQYPYISEIKGNEYRSAAQCGLNISPFARVYLPPVISSYVGADITAGILSCSLDESEKNILFIDIGTNGEMVLAGNGKMTATSTAAGPAFEGMNIEFGMRAADGAIESFEITEDYDIKIGTIGEGKPVGICGSALFDIAAQLARTGIIEKSGKLVKKEKFTGSEKLSRRLTKYSGKAAFEVADGVYLTQLDIRQIQLAKSAVRAGIEAMLSLNSLKPTDLDRVYIAGSFGFHLKVSSLILTGIVPASLEEKIEFAGNTSKTGGIAFLADPSLRDKIAGEAAAVRAVDLSQYPHFEEMFVKYMSF